MSEEHLDPAKSVIATIGGVEKVASITGRSITRVYRWMYPKDRGGTGGVIPHAEARKLLEYAEAERLPLSPNDFFAARQQSEAAA